MADEEEGVNRVKTYWVVWNLVKPWSGNGYVEGWEPQRICLTKASAESQVRMYKQAFWDSKMVRVRLRRPKL